MSDIRKMSTESSTKALHDGTIHVPIAQLKPTLASKDLRLIKAVVTLMWPYSSITSSISFLLSEPDFRLRKNRGQVRVQFSGSSGVSVVKAGIASGDRVTLSLKGAEWVKEDSDIIIPGNGIEFKLKFTEELSLQFQRDGSNDLKNVQIDHPPIDNLSTSITKFPTPDTQFNTAKTSSTLNHSHFKQAINSNDVYSSPAFVKRARTSYGSLFDSLLDSFTEVDGTSPGRERKRARLSLTWGYVDSSSPEEEENNPERSVIPVEKATKSSISKMVDQSVQTSDGNLVEKIDLIEQSSGTEANHGNINYISNEISLQRQSGTETQLISKSNNQKISTPCSYEKTLIEDKNIAHQKYIGHSLSSLTDDLQASFLPMNNNLPRDESNELVQSDLATEETKCALELGASESINKINDIVMEESDLKKNELSNLNHYKISPKIVPTQVSSCDLVTEETSNKTFPYPSNGPQSQGTQLLFSDSIAKSENVDMNESTAGTEDNRLNSSTQLRACHEPESDGEFHSIDLKSKIDRSDKEDLSFSDSHSAIARIEQGNEQISIPVTSPSKSCHSKASSPSSETLSRKTSMDFGDKIHKDVTENNFEHDVKDVTQKKTDLDRFKMSTEITGQFMKSKSQDRIYHETDGLDENNDIDDIDGLDEDNNEIDELDEDNEDMGGLDEDNDELDGHDEDLFNEYSDSETHDSYSEEREDKIRNPDLEHLEESDRDENENYKNKENITIIDLISDEEEPSTPRLAPTSQESSSNQQERNNEASEGDEIDEIDLLPYREEIDTKLKMTQDSSRCSSPQEEDSSLRNSNLDNAKDCKTQEHEDTRVHQNICSGSTPDNSVAVEEISDNVETIQNSISQSPRAENQRECSLYERLSSAEIVHGEEFLDINMESEKIDNNSFLDTSLLRNPINTEKNIPCTESHQQKVHLKSSMSESENAVEDHHDYKNSTYSLTSNVSKDSSSPPIPTDTIKSRLRGHDASIQLAMSSLSSPSKERSFFVDMKHELSRMLKTELNKFTSLQNLRYHSNEMLDVLAIVASLPPRPRRMRSGLKDYLITFNITDHTICPNDAVQVRVSRSLQEALPEVEIGNGILLHNFERISEKNKSILRSKSDEVSNWAVFKDTEDPKARGPPIKHGAAEEKYITKLKTWFSELDTGALAKMAKSNEKRTSGRK